MLSMLDWSDRSTSIGLFSSLSDTGAVVIEGERVERKVEVEIDALSFLNGRAKAFARFLTDFFREAALLERVEDAVKEVSVDLGMTEKQDKKLTCAAAPIL